MSPLAAYRSLFGLAGPLYVLVAFVGRLPLSMSQIGTMLLVSSATDSYGTGGLAAGALAVANAVGSPVAGGLADRIGQRPVVLVQSLVGAAGMATLVALTTSGFTDGVLVAAAGVTGLVLPQVGPLARVRWRPITDGSGPRQTRLMNAAFSYEGAADEASFVLGPALVGLMVALISPAGAILLAAALLVVFGCAFALHPTARLTGGVLAGHASGRVLSVLFVGLLAGQLLVGVLFGSIQTGAAALTAAEGRPDAAGLVHSLLGVGSALAGLATVVLPERIGHERRVLGAALFVVVFSTPLLLVDSIGALVAVVLVLGFGIAPYMIGIFSLGERLVPPGRVGLAMTLLGGATGVGYAVGSGIAGRLADAAGHTEAFAVTVGATVAALLLAGLGQRPLRRRTAAPEPSAEPVAA